MARLSPGDPDGQLSYVTMLAGDAPSQALLEVRYRLRSGGMASEFHAIRDRHRVLAAVNERARETDVYVGCAPRCRPDGRKQAIEQVWVLWAECDGHAASLAAQRHMPRPALVVASGTPGNVHAYWPLRAALSPRDAERANLRLATALGADRNCFDASRILRPPGTWNHKHNPPHRVTVVQHRLAVRFDVDQVVGSLPHIDLTDVDRRWEARPTGRGRSDPLLRIPPEVYVRELLGVRAVPNSKVRCPFHADDHPSLHVYRTAERGWHCFSCRRGGSIYDLAAEVLGLGTRGRDFIELRRRLNELFARDLARAGWAGDQRTISR
jgi:hypothetical protein